MYIIIIFYHKLKIKMFNQFYHITIIYTLYEVKLYV